MARERNPNRAKAKAMYLAAKGNIKLIDIAAKLNISDSLIRKWKSQDKWDDNSIVMLPINNSNVTNRKGTENKNIKEPTIKEFKEVIKNEELTDRQKLFCIYYSKCFNATKSYMKAYKVAYDTAAVEGSKNLKKPNIKAQIDKLTEITFNKAALGKGVIQKYIDIAFADITEYIEFGEEEKIQYDKDGQPQLDAEGEIVTFKYNYVKLGESKKVDGSLIGEVSEGKEGIKIKLADKMKALDFLTKHCNLLSDEEKLKLDLETKRLQNEKTEAEIKKIKGEDKNSKEPVRIVDDI